ncbi:MAG TPA: MarR family transcriptional regulator [Gemmatimonadaceae bacterium]
MATTPRPGIPVLPCACANLRRAARAVTQAYDRALRPTGLRPTQFTLLQALSLAGPLAQRELADILAIDSTTLSRTLAPLESSGWIRSLAGEDRRERRLQITGLGRQKLQRATTAWEGAQRRLRSRLGDEQWGALQSLLTATADAARR